MDVSFLAINYLTDLPSFSTAVIIPMILGRYGAGLDGRVFTGMQLSFVLTFLRDVNVRFSFVVVAF